MGSYSAVSAVNKVTFGVPTNDCMSMIYRIFGVAISIENTLLKYFIKRVLLDFLTLWPCCTGLLGL